MLIGKSLHSSIPGNLCEEKQGTHQDSDVLCRDYRVSEDASSVKRPSSKAARPGSSCKCPLLYVIPRDWIAVECCNEHQTETTRVEA